MLPVNSHDQNYVLPLATVNSSESGHISLSVHEMFASNASWCANRLTAALCSNTSCTSLSWQRWPICALQMEKRQRHSCRVWRDALMKLPLGRYWMMSARTSATSTERWCSPYHPWGDSHVTVMWPLFFNLDCFFVFVLLLMDLTSWCHLHNGLKLSVHVLIMKCYDPISMTPTT